MGPLNWPIAPPPRVTVAAIIAADGHCSYQRQGVGPWYRVLSPVQRPVPLGVNDLVYTDEDSAAAIEFAVGGRVGMCWRETVKIEGNRAASREMRDGQWEPLKLESGVIWVGPWSRPDPHWIKVRNHCLGIRG